jgi:hypothetical protein
MDRESKHPDENYYGGNTRIGEKVHNTLLETIGRKLEGGSLLQNPLLFESILET